MEEGSQDGSDDVIQIVSSRFVFTLGLIGGGRPSACSLQWEGSATHSYFASPEDRTQSSTENTGELSRAPSPIYTVEIGEGCRVQQASYSTELFLVCTWKQYFYKSLRLWLTAYNMWTFLYLTQILLRKKQFHTAHHTIYYQFALPLVFAFLFTVRTGS